LGEKTGVNHGFDRLTTIHIAAQSAQSVVNLPDSLKRFSRMEAPCDRVPVFLVFPFATPAGGA